jgi:hypothetical protein
MKTKHFISLTIIALMLFGATSIFAQPGHESNRDNGIKFTDDQKAKIKEIRMASYKEMKALRNQLGELKAKEQTLTTADKADMNAINANIDEITKVQNKMMKIKASNLQQIRNLLTDEQKMIFDSHGMDKGMWHKRSMHGDGDGFRGQMEHKRPQQES